MIIKWQTFKESGKWYAEGEAEIDDINAPAYSIVEQIDGSQGMMLPGYFTCRQHHLIISDCDDADAIFYPRMIPLIHIG